MHLMWECKRVADICKNPYHIGEVLEILMFGLKASRPVVDEWTIPGKMCATKCIHRQVHILLIHV